MVTKQIAKMVAAIITCLATLAVGEVARERSQQVRMMLLVRCVSVVDAETAQRRIETSNVSGADDNCPYELLLNGSIGDELVYGCAYFCIGSILPNHAQPPRIDAG